MPWVDHETLVSVCAGRDGKIGCGSLSSDVEGPNKKPDVPDASLLVPSDLPPESFCLSKDAELDWFVRNVFYQRNKSTKGNSNLTNCSSNSRPLSLNLRSTAAIFGLPTTRKKKYLDAKRRNSKLMQNIHLFPNRSEQVGKSEMAVTEPSSPKVSCMGKVRSMRGCRRTSELDRMNRKGYEKGRKGFSSCWIPIFCFRSGRPVQPDPERKEETIESSSSISAAGTTMDIPIIVEAPGLGAMERFASGRRSWSSKISCQSTC